MSAAWEALLQYALWMSGGRVQACALVRRVLGDEPGAPFERRFRRVHDALTRERSRADDASQLSKFEVVLHAEPGAPVGLAHPVVDRQPRRLQVLQWAVMRTCLMHRLLTLPTRQRAVWVLMTRIGADPERAAELLGLRESEAAEAFAHAWERLEAGLRPLCGFVERERPCRCLERLGPALERGLVSEPSPLFPAHGHDALRGLPLDELYSSLPTRDLEDEAARAVGGAPP